MTVTETKEEKTMRKIIVLVISFIFVISSIVCSADSVSAEISLTLGNIDGAHYTNDSLNIACIF